MTTHFIHRQTGTPALARKATLPLSIVLLVVAMLMAIAPTLAQTAENSDAQPYVDLVAASDTFTDWLPESYRVDAWGPDDDDIWYIDFYEQAEDDDGEWLGYAQVDASTGEIVESFAPKTLAPDVYQSERDLLIPVVLNDAEVLAWLNSTPDLWELNADWNRWEQYWDVYFSRGITAILVQVYIVDGKAYIGDIVDPNVLEEEQQRDEIRDRAVSIAYSDENADTALTGYDDWTTYVEQQGDQRWSISFLSDGRLLLFVLVDTVRDIIIESEMSAQE